MAMFKANEGVAWIGVYDLMFIPRTWVTGGSIGANDETPFATMTDFPRDCSKGCPVADCLLTYTLPCTSDADCKSAVASCEQPGSIKSSYCNPANVKDPSSPRTCHFGQK